MGPSIKVDGAAVIGKAFAEMPDITRQELIAATWQAELLLQREVTERTPVGVNAALRASITSAEPRILADSVIGAVGTPLNYAIPVELGTKPHMPPVQPLVDWARHKLGLSGEEAERAGLAIAHKIKREGTKGAHMFEEAFDANRDQVARIYAKAARNIVAQMEGKA